MHLQKNTHSNNVVHTKCEDVLKIFTDIFPIYNVHWQFQMIAMQVLLVLEEFVALEKVV